MNMVERRLIVVVHHEDADLGDPRGAVTVAGSDSEAFVAARPTVDVSRAPLRIVTGSPSGAVETWTTAVPVAST